jgi:DNA-binding beta-propeller fold protein YncE
VSPTEHTAKPAPTPKTGIFALLRGPLPNRGTGAPKIGQARRLPLAFALTAILTLVVGVASASAAVEHKEIASFTGAETPTGSFGKANGVAVDAATGDVYVADIANNVVDKFTAAGTYICQITGSTLPSASECNGVAGSATPAGSFAFSIPAAVAVDNSTSAADPSADDVYVLDKGHDVIDKFSAAGAYLGEVGGSFSGLEGIGVDAEGNLWVYESSSTVDEFSPSGSLIKEFPHQIGAVHAFAVDSNDNTYLTNDFGVEKYNSAGSSLGSIDNCGFCQAAIATDLSTDNVYVDDESYVAEYDAAGNPVIQFGETQLASGGESGGIAVNPVSGDVYLASGRAGTVYVFGPAPGPRVVPLPASDIHTTSCTFNATVNPEGAATTYQFEYGTSTEYEQSLPSAPASAGSGTTPVAESVEPTDLLGGTSYHYRVVATNANGTIDGADRTCTTLPIPVIEGAEAPQEDLTASTADLKAQINPAGSFTTYYFEYLAEKQYNENGKTFTGAEKSSGTIPAGTTDTPVSAHIEKLEANITYYWRVVATNANGTTTGVDHTFVYETTGGGLPDNRAYEMVTPPQKDAALIVTSGGIKPDIAPDGSRVILDSVQCLPGSVSCAADTGLVGTPVAFSRTSAGWVTSPLAPPATEFANASNFLFSAEADTGLWGIPTPSRDEDDWYAREPDGSFTDIGPITPPERGALGRTDVKDEVATADLSHVVWEAEEGGTWPFDETEKGGDYLSLYEYAGTDNTAPTMVGVEGGPGSRDLISQCGTELGGGTQSANSFNSLSADGSKVFFLARGHDSGEVACPAALKAPPVNELYARVNQSESVDISEPSPNSNCTDPACETNDDETAQFRNATFEGASEDGSKVFFTSTQQLTNEGSQDSTTADTANVYGSGGCEKTTGADGCNLYEAELGEVEEAGSRKTIVKSLVAASAGDSSGDGPRVRHVEAISSDGSHVYFVAKGVLTNVANGQGQIARSGAENLYVYERDATSPEGKTAFIATLPAVDFAKGEEDIGEANVTPDGQYLVFESLGALTPDVNRSEGPAQIYRYDAETAELVRISIGEHGFNDNGNAGALGVYTGNGYTGDAHIAPAYRSFFHAGAPRTDPTMSNDGSYVFFESPVALTRGALNDVPAGVNHSGATVYAQNVYEYHKGQVYLISDGRDTSEFAEESSTGLIGSDTSGKNVFFTTADQLVPKDTDTQVDTYDARICEPENGNPCIAEPAPPPAPCQGEACHGIPPAPPSLLSPGSAFFNGQGNITPAAVVKAKAKPLTRAQKLTDALKVCRKDKRKSKRQTCEKQARAKYGPTKKKAKSKKAGHGGRTKS